METFGLYLLKSAVWLTGFTLIFLTVLRNERYFQLNRIYLLTGVLASIAFPLYTWHYVVILPATTGNVSISGLSAQVIDPQTPAIPIYWWFYLAGVIWLAFRLIWQTLKVIRKLRKAGYEVSGSVKLVRTPEYAASFSFFSYVFVNPSTSDVETREIVNHESEHIRQRHWFDLLLTEIICMLQWFNPFVWVYAHLIRQNHEYLADERALQHTADPAIYQATLLNQLLGAPVISLANSFSYSRNKKRFTMMKKSIYSPFRKLRLLLILPLIALVFYAFAKPEYIAVSAPGTISDFNNLISSHQDAKDVVKGKVVNADGKPLAGTSVMLKGSMIGTITDENGSFELTGIPKDGELVFSYVGYQTFQTKADVENAMMITMNQATVGIDKVVVVGSGDTKTPPSPGSAMFFADSKNNPLFIVDGTPVSEAIFKSINPETIESVNVLKGESAISKYGEKGANGVVEVTMKKDTTSNGKNGKIAMGYQVTKHLQLPSKGQGNGYNPGEQESINTQLIFLDRLVTDKAKMDAILPGEIESVAVWKGKDAINKFGEKGKNGVIEITSKKGGTTELTTKKGEFSTVSGSEQVDQPFVIVEEMPRFPGGEQALMKFIGNNIKYPKAAKESGITGTVIVNFVIDKKGEITRIRVMRGIGGGCDEEATRVIALMPKWSPGMQKGQVVDVSYTIPIKFALDGNGLKNVDDHLNKIKQPFVMVEEMPQFPGGEAELMKFIGTNVKYPAQAKASNAEGTVVVSFIIKSTGKVVESKVVRGVQSDLDAEALRVIETMPDWQPGKQHGEPVDVSYTIPIQFKLH